MIPTVVLENIAKCFIVQQERPRSFQELLIHLFRESEKETLWALRDISFVVHQGETLGLIGQNGSGKSTLLKLISRILEPTAGKIQVRGQVSALIELGAGFHPDLTGRENIFLNGSLLGLSRAAMESRLDEIIAFAELGRFIDMPLKHYSSGMQMRLGFAIATCIDPDILLIDEVLAVGDEAFQRKCLTRINQIRGQDKTIIFVSHDLGVVRRVCDRVIWLDDGRIVADGPAHDVVAQYLMHVGRNEEAGPAVSPSAGEDEVAVQQKRWGTGEAKITAVHLSPGPPDARPVVERPVFSPESQMYIDLHYRARYPLEEVVFGFAFFRTDGTYCYGTNTDIEGHCLGLTPGTGHVQIIIDRLGLLPGEYTLDVAIHAPNEHPYDYWREARRFRVSSTLSDSGIFRPSHRWVWNGVPLDESFDDQAMVTRSSPLG